MSCLVELRDATIGYGRMTVIERVNLRLDCGDFVVVRGPNGGGKTTLLKTIAGLLPPLGGTRDVSARFGYVPQLSTAAPALPVTVLELVELGASSAAGLGASLWRPGRALLRDCLEKCHAWEYAKRPFAELSGGQQQRALLARALAVSPDVLLLDEPTSGIDLATEEFIAAFLSELNRESRVAVVLVTHEPELFDAAAGRVLTANEGVLKEGRDA
jgi:ABC-type Mn2+/Zn2+ transport system ATPase subunit